MVPASPVVRKVRYDEFTIFKLQATASTFVRFRFPKHDYELHGPLNVDLWISYNSYPDPLNLGFRYKIALPSTKADFKLSATSLNCIPWINNHTADCIGDPYGLLFDQEEISACKHRSGIGECYIFIALRLQKLDEIEKTDIAIHTSSIDCPTLIDHEELGQFLNL